MLLLAYLFLLMGLVLLFSLVGEILQQPSRHVALVVRVTAAAIAGLLGGFAALLLARLLTDRNEPLSYTALSLLLAIIVGSALCVPGLFRRGPYAKSLSILGCVGIVVGLLYPTTLTLALPVVSLLLIPALGLSDEGRTA